jgi:glutamate/tyrosine decarboxylase-like PLP-dependent enzyme
MVSLGKQGYQEAAQRILDTGAWIKAEIQKIPELTILGDPLWVIAFTSKTLNIYKVMDLMSKKKWSLNGLFSPPAVHLCITLLHTHPGVRERFVEDLSCCVEEVKSMPKYKGEMAPIYGMASGLPMHGLVNDMLKQYMDMLYHVPE